MFSYIHLLSYCYRGGGGGGGGNMIDYHRISEEDDFVVAEARTKC